MGKKISSWFVVSIALMLLLGVGLQGIILAQEKDSCSKDVYKRQSIATPQIREAAVERIRQALAGGYMPVAVVSAMGRAGAPYATDTLKKLAENIYSQISLRELDLIMHCGEIISAVVLAATLHKAGIKARAFTGFQAGLTTDGCYGQARVVACEPDRIKQLSLIHILANPGECSHRGQAPP